ncbi:MAG TPA: MarC family protein [Mycobacteriales bacterium]|nr:MarC family protein [Mycobacteriales bacterium]
MLKVVREGGIQLITRIFGLLLSAIAVQFIADAVRGFIEATP